MQNATVTCMIVAAILTTTAARPGADQLPLLTARATGSSVLVSFDLRADEASDLDQRLGTGQPVWVTWSLELRRKVPLWVDRDRRRAELKVSARPAPAAGLFAIQRVLDGRSLGPLLLVDRAGALRHLLSFEALELVGAAPTTPADRLRLTVSAVLQGGGQQRISTPVLADAVVQP